MKDVTEIKMDWSLRKIHSEDADWIFEACQDPSIQKWTQIPKPYLREHAESFTIDLAGDVAAWVIERVSDSRPCGVIAVHSITQPEGVAESGYWMAPWGRGKGGMSAAINLLIDQLRTWPEVKVIQASLISQENVASRRTLERTGFTFFAEDENASCRISYRRSLPLR
jgi:RimJ/RimL family protein N-acetyltransferase